MKRSLLPWLQDLGVVAGFLAFVFGLYQAWRPLAAIVGGLLLAGGCVLAAYDRNRKEAIARVRDGGRL